MSLESEVINAIQELNEKVDGIASAPSLQDTLAVIDSMYLPMALTSIQNATFDSVSEIIGQVRIRVFVQQVGHQIEYGSALETDHRIWANLRTLYTDSDRYSAGYGSQWVIEGGDLKADNCPRIELIPPFTVTRFPRPQLYPEGVNEWAFLGFDVLVNFRARDC